MRALILLALLAIVHSHVFAQSGSIEVPENARVKEYGNGWECNQGYRAVDGACTAVKLPANAYLTNTSCGSDWECVRGYREINGAAQPLGCQTMRTPQIHPAGVAGGADEVIGSLTIPAQS